MTMMKTLTLTACALLVLHCSSGGGTTDGGTGNDGSSNNDGSNSGDSGSDAAAAKPYTGFVDLASMTVSGKPFHSVTPVFFNTPTGTPAGCTGTKSGSCCYEPPTTSDGGTGTAPTPASAGTITLTDGTATIATLMPGAMMTYKTVTDPPTAALIWKDGDTVKVAGTGAAVHPFMGSVVVASAVAGVMPSLSLTTPIVIDRSKDFTFTWTAANGHMNVGISALKGGALDGLISCDVPDTGTITIPTTLLINFAATDTAEVVIDRISNGDASNDNATITIASTASTNGSATFK
jgi:hypothetical protein